MNLRCLIESMHSAQNQTTLFGSHVEVLQACKGNEGFGSEKFYKCNNVYSSQRFTLETLSI